MFFFFFTDIQRGSWDPPPESGNSSIPMLQFDNKDTDIRLYNIKSDPYEKRNIATLYPSLVTSLLNRLKFYYEKSVKPRRGVDHNAAPVANGPQGKLAWTPWLD